jgi:hypothetical protein
MEPLPFTDEHTVVAKAAPEAVFDAARASLDAPQSGVAGGYARLVGVRGERLFDVARAERPSLLALVGRHRFSRYALTFTMRQVGPMRTELTAHTNAVFPGIGGSLYRALVIRTGAHVVMTRMVLRRIARRAERG